MIAKGKCGNDTLCRCAEGFAALYCCASFLIPNVHLKEETLVFIRSVFNLLRIGSLLLAASALAGAVPIPPQNTKDVNVVNVPNVNVANTPTVNVGNTANVNVANTPTVQLSGNSTLGVKNASTAPLIIRDADNPARSFFQQHFSFVVQDGSFGATADLGAVPANSTLVIEYINMQVRLPGQQSVTAVVFEAGSSDTLAFAPVETISNTGTDSTWIVSQPLKMYVPANTNMKLFFGRTSSVGISQFGSVEISGYLVSQ